MNIFKTLSFIAHHPVSSRNRFAALFRFLGWQIRSRISPDVIFNWIDNSKLLVSNGMTGATGNIYTGLHEFRDMSFVLHILREGDLFIDVGANIGSYTVLASAVCKASSIAVEPDPRSAERLLANIKLNQIEDLAEIAMCAVGESEGSIGFTRDLDTMNRVILEPSEEERVVPMVTLDALLEGRAPMIMKLDVEGFETQVLRGATAALENPKLSAILIETVDEECLHILERNGFERSGYDPKLKLMCPQDAYGSANTLFVRNQAMLQSRLENSELREFRGYKI